LLDASFIRQTDREHAKKLAERLGAAFYVIECVCAEDRLKNRLIQRQREGQDVSDGRWEIFRHQQQEAEPITEMAVAQHIILDTAQPVEDLLEEIVHRITQRKG
jgi:hypothetical protein